MITELKVPKFDANAEEATVTAWFRKEADSVNSGERVVELTTDKASFELEAPATGTVLRILAKEKSIVPVGFILALIGDPSATLPDAEAANRLLLERLNPARSASSGRQPARPAAGQAVKMTPVARKLAKDHGLDPAAIRAETGAETITEEIVRKFIAGAG